MRFLDRDGSEEKVLIIRTIAVDSLIIHRFRASLEALINHLRNTRRVLCVHVTTRRALFNDAVPVVFNMAPSMLLTRSRSPELTPSKKVFVFSTA